MPLYDEMLGTMKSLPGFQGLSLLFNEDAHQAVSLSYWQDQEAATEAGVALLPHLMNETQVFVDRPPEVTGFELLNLDMVTT